jgi:hypothetical protein
VHGSRAFAADGVVELVAAVRGRTGARH